MCHDKNTVIRVVLSFQVLFLQLERFFFFSFPITIDFQKDSICFSIHLQNENCSRKKSMKNRAELKQKKL